MLDLEARVHFHEVEFSVLVHNKLECASFDVIRLWQPKSQLLRFLRVSVVRSGFYFKNRVLKEINKIKTAWLILTEWYKNIAYLGLTTNFFNQHLIIIKRFERLNSFNDNRIGYFFHFFKQTLFSLIQLMIALDDGHFSSAHDKLTRALYSHVADSFPWSANEN